ncbi:aromatic ring-hydroxylating oxygenase subunit alpha [Gordonia metallireducens]|uniref:aromatic ring-hydroxylating oxygenase subunit alpha n=1 Tax=Gordonia metallireducens TaxID=2897779 RepID=UPI001E358DE8|nr:aromatic ring-hydroxylating dioxygenase subunit alpha [Gordonia metallireducens]
MNTIPPLVQDVLDRLGVPEADFTTARTMPTEVYTSEEFYEFEKEAIFAKEWLCLGHVSQIPKIGDYYTITVGDEPLIVTRDNDENVRVMSAICQHRAYPVVEDNDKGNTKEFRCPYHYWAYNLEGQLKTAPEMKRTCTMAQLRSETSLPNLKVEIWHGMIFANMDLDAAQLAPQLVKLEEEMEIYGVANLELTDLQEFPGLEWNWKGMHENALEPYHTSFVHMGYHEVAPASMAEFVEFEDTDNVIMHPTNYRYIDAGFNPTGKVILPVFPGLDELRRSRIMFASILPTVFFAFSPDQVFYFLITPESANTMTLRAAWLFPPEIKNAPGFEWTFEMQNAVNQVINDQDMVTNKRMQDGQKSRYAKRGRYSWQETTLPQVNRWLALRYQSHAKSLTEAD